MPRRVTQERPIERVQIGARMEKRLVKVLKSLAEYLDMPLGELLEGIALHVLEGKTPFSRQTLSQIKQLRAVYGLTLTAADSHQLKETNDADRTRIGSIRAR